MHGASHLNVQRSTKVEGVKNKGFYKSREAEMLLPILPNFACFEESIRR